MNKANKKSAKHQPLDLIEMAVNRFVEQCPDHPELAIELPTSLLGCILKELSYEQGVEMLKRLRSQITSYLESGDRVW